MNTVNTMEAIRDFILGCPYLKDGYLQVDFLGDKPMEYTLDTSPEGGALAPLRGREQLMRVCLCFRQPRTLRG